MAKILTYGFGLDMNFGGPSVIHGLRDSLEQVFPGCRFVVYQPGAVDPVSASDLDVPIRAFPYRKRMFKFYRDWILLKLFGRRSRSAACAQFWDDYLAADAVVNAYPICFCGKLRTHLSVKSRWGAVCAFFREFGPNLVAGLDGKVSVKSTASYGPFGGRPNALLARLACRHGFTRALVREEECRAELAEAAGCDFGMMVAPDLATAWRPSGVGPASGRLGISVSYQSERKWRGKCRYVELMRDLVGYALDSYGCDVVLFPNQFMRNGVRDDDAIAREVKESFSGDARVTIFDARHSAPSALRDAIASCEALVTCRYHSCVAAFASGVPQMILGWHCKYEVLADLYGQREWVLPEASLTVENACGRLDELWRRRAVLRSEILARSAGVRAAVRRSLEWLFAGLFPNVSVVVPVFNVEKYLPRCLDSLLGQTMRDIEIICVDDGSTDGSPAILEEYAAKDSRIKVIHQANAGAGAARNAGLERATGEYLFFFDPDDSCDKKMLAVLYARARMMKADVVVAGKKIVDAETAALIKDVPLPRRMAWFMRQPFPPQKIAGRLFSFAKAVPWDKMFRRKFVEENGLRFQTLPRSNDVYFVDMALALAKRIALVRRGYYRYSLRRSGSLTLTKDRYPLATLDAYAAVEASLKRCGAWEDFRVNFAEVFLRLMVDQATAYRDEAIFRTVYAEARRRFLDYSSFCKLCPRPDMNAKQRQFSALWLEHEAPDALWAEIERRRRK